MTFAVVLISGLGVIGLATWLGRFPPRNLSLPTRVAIVTLAYVALVSLAWVLRR